MIKSVIFIYFQVLFGKIEKVEDCVHDARLVKNLSLIVQTNMSRVSGNAITFRHEDFAKRLCHILADSKKAPDFEIMTKDKLIKLGLQVKLIFAAFIVRCLRINVSFIERASLLKIKSYLIFSLFKSNFVHMCLVI